MDAKILYVKDPVYQDLTLLIEVNISPSNSKSEGVGDLWRC